MAQKKKDININKGPTDILLIAPHGINEAPKDDINTNLLSYEIAKHLDCYSIVNDAFHRHELDFNSIKEVSTHKTFIPTVRKVLKNSDTTLVIWIHGIGDDGLKDEIRKMGINEKVDCLIGYGQPDRRTAQTNTVNKLIALLKKNGFAVYKTRAEAEDYRGRSLDNMNQWFRTKAYSLSKVQSIQLEFSKEIRKEKNIAKYANSISDAISKLVRPEIQDNSEKATDRALSKLIETNPDKALVDKAFNFLKGIFIKHFHQAMLEAGRYIIKEFYNNDIELARQNKQVKKHSLHQLIKRLQENKGRVPSKTWIYDAVNLVVDEHNYNNFSVYGKLGHSHKVFLTRVRDPETKKQLIQEIYENEYTIDKLRKRWSKIRENGRIKLDALPPKSELRKIQRDELIRLRDEAQRKVRFHQDKMNSYQKSIDTITNVLNAALNKSNKPTEKAEIINLRKNSIAKKKTEKRQRNEPKADDNSRERGIV